MSPPGERDWKPDAVLPLDECSQLDAVLSPKRQVLNRCKRFALTTFVGREVQSGREMCILLEGGYLTGHKRDQCSVVDVMSEHQAATRLHKQVRNSNPPPGASRKVKGIMEFVVDNKNNDGITKH